ncbi:hypothetical protein [Okeania sp. SIO3B5]|nr:hypothetical protein [Okeania sp. SIO3B5]
MSGRAASGGTISLEKLTRLPEADPSIRFSTDTNIILFFDF